MKQLKTLLISVLALGGLVACGSKHVHAFGAEWDSDGETHWHTCECGETDEKAPHDFIGDFSCDENGHWRVCVCGVVGPKEAHTFEKEFDEDLLANVYTCKFCGYNYSEDAKLDWTKDEKTLINTWLQYELPFVPGYDLTLDEDNSGEVLVFTGSKAAEKDVDAYAEAFAKASYENVEGTEDIYDVWDFHNDYFYQFRKARNVQSGYLPILYDTVAVGLNAGNKKITIIATLSYCFNDDTGVDSSGRFNAYYVTEQQNVGYMFDSFAGRSMTQAAKLYGLTYSNQIPTPTAELGAKSEKTATNGTGALGVVDYQWNNPWTLGNLTSEGFMVDIEFMLIGGDTEETTYVASDANSYVAQLTAAGFKPSADNPSLYISQVEGLGILGAYVGFYAAGEYLNKSCLVIEVMFMPELAIDAE